MASDYEKAAFLTGACFENSDIKATDTLVNENFIPPPAPGALLEWLSDRSATAEIRSAAQIGLQPGFRCVRE